MDKNLCLEKINNTLNHKVHKELTNKDKSILFLLGQIMIIDNKELDSEQIFNQLKESYFSNDDVTANFILKLYDFDSATMDNYFDIYLEQTIENAKNKEEIDDRIRKMQKIIGKVSQSMLMNFNKKLDKYKE